ncbi:MAG TPA: FemAB family XrtA/PEP-CTERM system-associated protein [Planctomycetota bacterium]|nr:FemAB family XrtA/PEP-CTERM system-associated protein [Planctomycetota bacterium]
MTDSIEVRPSVAESDDELDAFVRAHPRGTLFHQSRWRRVVERVFRHRPAGLEARAGDRLVGVLPLMQVPALPIGRNLLSMPYAVYGGPVGESDAVCAALVRGAQRLAEQRGARRLELRCLAPLPAEVALPEGDLYVTFFKDLPADPADVLARMPKKARAEARKARERHGLELIEGNWYLDDLHRLFALNKRSLGSPSLPATLFRELLAELGRDAVVHLVHRRREPLSAVLSFVDGDTLIAYYSGTAPAADRDYSASNFMYLALQEWAVRRGFRRFDFCRSRRDSGAFRFKQHQGFEPTPLHYAYHLVRSRSLPTFTPSNPRTRLLRRAWSRLPSAVVDRISPALARRLP